ncbi:MAG: penicillin-binding transpeptidase domain-containing protein, partial [Miltoncostaeaceae bacterium]
GYTGNEVIGIGGLEEQYESLLRGVPGRSVYEVEASGEPRAQPPVSTELPRQGNDIQTSIHIDIQAALEASLARRSERLGSGRGAGVVLDVRTGQVVASASYPTFDPAIFVERRPRAIERLYTNPRQPVFNRVTQGVYPVGSTFKHVTAVAGLRTGFISPGSTLESSATVELYDQTFQNFRFEQHGSVNVSKAIEVSSDTFFYQIGDNFFRRDDSPLQDEARRFGFGSPTGIDLPSESAGLVPDPTWKKRRFAGPDFDPFDREWRPGDTIQLTVGQGYFQATPLQLAQSYAAIANGGTLNSPTIGGTVLEPNGRAVRSVAEGATARDSDLADEWLTAIREGVFLASNGSEGTSTSVFGALPEGSKVAGKTGTAETGQPAEGGGFTPDHSWFAGYGPADDPRYAIAVVVENAGTGSNAAAPVACETMTIALDVDPEDCGSASQAEPGI